MSQASEERKPSLAPGNSTAGSQTRQSVPGSLPPPPSTAGGKGFNLTRPSHAGTSVTQSQRGEAPADNNGPGGSAYRVTLRSKRPEKNFWQKLWEARTRIYFGVFILSIVAFNVVKRSMRGEEEMGYQTRLEVTRDYVGFFVMAFFFARYLSLPSLALLWTSIAAFHYALNIHYYDAPKPGLHSHHLQYFVLVYFVSLGILVAMKTLSKKKRRSRLKSRRSSKTTNKGSKIKNVIY